MLTQRFYNEEFEWHKNKWTFKIRSTYTGHYEDAKTVNDLLKVKNEENGWDVPIHIDAASGGFVAPFVNPDLVWDFSGFTSIMTNLMEIANYLAQTLEDTNIFEILSDRNGIGLPLVAFKLKLKDIHYDEFDVAARLRERGWIVPAYTMAPHTEHIKLMRIVVREDFSRERCDILVTDIKSTIELLNKLDKETLHKK
ncbi:19907_t:CDS:2, partial [Racocetra fulgida]